MCGRYYIDSETAAEIEKLIRQTNEKLKRESMISINRITAKDICPTQMAPVLEGAGNGVSCRWQQWGFAGFKEKQVIFNARCELIMEKPLFRDSFCHNRIVIPATWFYEWNQKKEKNTFSRKETPVLFMAGCSRPYEDGAHFVILTTKANSSMKPVHDRMPLILDQDEIIPWILNEEKAAKILDKTPCVLKRQSDYEQLSLF